MAASDKYVEKPVQELIGDFYQAHAAGNQEGMDGPLKILQRKIFEGNLDSKPFIDYYNDMFSGRTSFNALVSVKDYPFESIFRELLQNTFDCFYDVPDVKIIVNFKDNNEISLSYNEIGFTMEQFLYYLAFGRNKIDKYKEGRFGVGAKSVFMNVQQLTMRSNNFGFKIVNNCGKGESLTITELDLLRDLVKGTEINVKVSDEQYARIKDNFMTMVDKKGDFINLVELCFAFNRKKVMNVQKEDKEEPNRTFNIAVMDKGKIATLYKIAYAAKPDGAKADSNRIIRLYQNNKSVVDFICHEQDGFSYLIPFAVAASKRHSIVKTFMQKYNFFSTYELTGLIASSQTANAEKIFDEKLSAFFVSVPNAYITMSRTGIKADSEPTVSAQVERGVNDLIKSYGEYFVLDLYALPGVENRYGFRPKSYAFEFIKNFILTSKLVSSLKGTFQENISIQFPGEPRPIPHTELKLTAYLQDRTEVPQEEHTSGDAYTAYILGERDKLISKVGNAQDTTLCLVYSWVKQGDGGVQIHGGKEFYYEFIRGGGTYIAESKAKQGLQDYNLHIGFNSIVGATLGEFTGDGKYVVDEDALESVFSFFDDTFNEDYRMNMRYYQLFVTYGDEEHIVDISKIKVSNLKNAMETLRNRRHRFDTAQAFNETAKVILNVFTAEKDTITFLREIRAQGGVVTLALDVNKKYRFSVYGHQFLIPGRITNSQMLEIVGDMDAMIDTGMLFGRRFDFPISPGKFVFDAKEIHRLLKGEDVLLEDVQNILPRLFISNLGIAKIALLGAGDKFLGIIGIEEPIPEQFDGQIVRMVVLKDDHSKAQFAGIIEHLLIGENRGLISGSLVKTAEPNIVLADQMPYYNRPLPEITREEFDFLRGEIKRIADLPGDNFRNYLAKDVNFKLFGYGGCCPLCDIESETINSFNVREFTVEAIAPVGRGLKEKTFNFSLYMCANDACAAGGWVIEDLSVGGMNPFVWLKELAAAETIVPEFLHCSVRLTSRVTHEVPITASVPAQGKAFATPPTVIDFVLSPLLAAKWVEDNTK
ncbi:MAG: hypothetical protein FWG45_02980 [Oscillospiraceae bacterium]|nr:hypothetical protein [Oscillospiraceae bacterium]